MTRLWSVNGCQVWICFRRAVNQLHLATLWQALSRCWNPDQWSWDDIFVPFIPVLARPRYHGPINLGCCLAKPFLVPGKSRFADVHIFTFFFPSCRAMTRQNVISCKLQSWNRINYDVLETTTTRRYEVNVCDGVTQRCCV